MIKLWTLIAEFLGVASGVLLLVPAIALNKHLRTVTKAMGAFKSANTRFGQAIGEASNQILKDLLVPKWSAVDQFTLFAGTVLLMVSFFIKFLVVLVSP